MENIRCDGRKSEELRPIRILAGTAPYAEGSAEVHFGKTHLLVTASVESETPKWMSAGTDGEKPLRGWITAEYGMLPRATHTRNKREAAQGKQSGRTQEIQRLIGRSLRAAVDLSLLPGISIRLDCDVICADGGTRTAAISGGWVALHQCIRWCEAQGLVKGPVPVQQIAAISVGFSSGVPLLDLCYEEDSRADFDLNIVQDELGRLIEVQGTAEKMALAPSQFIELLEIASLGIREIQLTQRKAVS